MLNAAHSARALIAAGLPATGEVVPATDPRFGDYQTNAALVLAKQRGQNPRALAQKIIEHLDVGDGCVEELVREVRQGACNRELFAHAGPCGVVRVSSRSTPANRHAAVDLKPCLCFGLVGVLTERDL